VVTQSSLTPTARVQLTMALSSLTQASILSWVGEMCIAISKQWVTAAVEDCVCKLSGVAGIKRVGGR